MIKIKFAAALLLGGLLFAAEAFAQNNAANLMHLLAAYAGESSVSRPQDAGAFPVFRIKPEESKIKFDVEASVSIVGSFDKWDATLTFTSPDVSTGVLDVKIQAATVDTGSGLKNGKLKGPDFFDVANNPLITFKSTKISQTGPATFEVDGNFTIR